ncbi:MAG: DUF3089 domain-containing protein [Micropepsaceae bacterium]
MLRLLKWLFALALLIGGAGAAVYLTGNTLTVIGWLWGPKHGWDLSLKAPALDYRQASSWAAWPGRESGALYTPRGVFVPDGAKAVDVFFIHPTGFLNGAEWNSPMNPQSRTEENTKWMMANQASAFNGCCNVYAPRYREASIFRYWTAPEDIAQKTMDFAYADVVRAFEYYMANENKGRPFIIASHSQGTSHALRLVQEKIDGTNLEASMIAAYVIGSRVTNAEANALKSVKVCDSPTQTDCIVHWATFGEGTKVPPEMSDLVCVNPLTWRRDGVRAEAAMHQGGVAASGKFSMQVWGDDSPQGVVFEPLGPPLPKLTWAECKDGILWAADQSKTPLGRLSLRGNYHGLDYPLFHMDIRKNVADRVAAYQQRGPAGGPGPAK